MRHRWSESTYEIISRLNNKPNLSNELKLILYAMKFAQEYSMDILLSSLQNLRKTGKTNTIVMPVRGVLVLPVGDKCNLTCSYCYESGRREMAPPKVMDKSVFRKIVNNLFPYVQPPFTISFHGGEPLLAGKEFFRYALGLIRSASGGNDIKINVQTNATLIDPTWTRIFKKYNVLVGLSLDGPVNMHDINRNFSSGRGSYHMVQKGIKVLRKANVPFRVITVVNSKHVQTIRDCAHQLFTHFKKIGIKRFDVHPSFSHSYSTRTENLSPTDFSKFIIDLFECWLREGDPTIHIGFFDQFFQAMTGRQPVACYLSGRCTEIIGCLADGEVIPCTRPFDSSYKFGNLTSEPLSKVMTSKTFNIFKEKEMKGQIINPNCIWSTFCKGGCPHERLTSDLQAIDGKNIYCTCEQSGEGGYPEIFTYIKTRVESLFAEYDVT